MTFIYSETMPIIRQCVKTVCYTCWKWPSSSCYLQLPLVKLVLYTVIAGSSGSVFLLREQREGEGKMEGVRRKRRERGGGR